MIEQFELLHRLHSSSLPSRDRVGTEAMEERKRADEPDVEPAFFARKSGERKTLSELCGGVENGETARFLTQAGVLPSSEHSSEDASEHSSGTVLAFVDAHNVLEVNGELNAEIVDALNELMEGGKVRVIVLSWVGWTPLDKVSHEIRETMGEGNLAHSVPIVTCTGNRVAKMAFLALAVAIGAESIRSAFLIDDSDRNLVAARDPENLARVHQDFGFSLPIEGHYYLYVKKGARNGRPIGKRKYASRVVRTVEAYAQAVRVCGTAIASSTSILVDRNRQKPVLPSHDSTSTSYSDDSYSGSSSDGTSSPSGSSSSRSASDGDGLGEGQEATVDPPTVLSLGDLIRTHVSHRSRRSHRSHRSSSRHKRDRKRGRKRDRDRRRR